MPRLAPRLVLRCLFVPAALHAQPVPSNRTFARPLAQDYPLAPALRTPSVQAPLQPVHWAHTATLGASLGLGAPSGYLGAFLAHNPFRWLQLEVGGGYSVPFGPSVGFMTRAGVDPGNDSLASVGIGVSANFTDYRYVVNCTYAASGLASDRASCTPVGAPVSTQGTAYPLWLNLEVAEDLRTLGNFGARGTVGASVLFDPGAFPGALGCPTGAIGHVPCNAAVARHEGQIFWQFYAHLDVYFLLFDGR